MSFKDLLNKPLPSAKQKTDASLSYYDTKYYTESEDEVAEEVGGEAASTEEYEENDPTNVNEDSDEELDGDDLTDDDLDDIDISSLSDEELSELEADIADSDIEDAIGDVEEVKLSPEEEKEADDLMAVSATTEVIRSELSAEEQKDFYESTEAQIAVYEGFLLESDLLSEDTDVMTEATKRKFYNKTRVQFSKKDRLAQLFAVAVNVSAKAHNDPLYTRYQKILKLRRVTRSKLRKKYKAEAIRRMKVYYQRLRSSKSPVLNKVAKKVDPNKVALPK